MFLVSGNSLQVCFLCLKIQQRLAFYLANEHLMGADSFFYCWPALPLPLTYCPVLTLPFQSHILSISSYMSPLLSLSLSVLSLCVPLSQTCFFPFPIATIFPPPISSVHLFPLTPSLLSVTDLNIVRPQCERGGLTPSLLLVCATVKCHTGAGIESSALNETGTLHHV